MRIVQRVVRRGCAAPLKGAAATRCDCGAAPSQGAAGPSKVVHSLCRLRRSRRCGVHARTAATRAGGRWAVRLRRRTHGLVQLHSTLCMRDAREWRCGRHRWQIVRRLDARRLLHGWRWGQSWPTSYGTEVRQARRRGAPKCRRRSSHVVDEVLKGDAAEGWGGMLVGELRGICRRYRPPWAPQHGPRSAARGACWEQRLY
jgi:hypothetical protein